MRKTYSRKSMIGLCFLVEAFSVFALVAIIYFSILYFSSLQRIDIGAFVIGISFGLVLMIFAALLVIGVFMLNRGCCKVIYDSDTQTIYRKGFICGYKYELKVENIKEIFVAPLPRDCTCFVIVDDVNYQYELTKKSFIQLQKTKYNHTFIKQFWNKPITEYNYLHPTDGPKNPINIII